MTDEGPPLELLLRRLAETPPDFLADPIVRKKGAVHTLAVVNDVLRLHGATSTDARLAGLGRATVPEDGNRLRLLLVLAWLLADDWFVQRKHGAVRILTAMSDAAAELAGLVKAAAVVSDPERREELARLALARLSMRPAGESEAFARDRMTAMSTAERTRVLAASRQAEERARSIRAELARKAAQEAADKWGRE
jgi:hypothetical protein